jgi:hypothetical protein
LGRPIRGLGVFGSRLEVVQGTEDFTSSQACCMNDVMRWKGSSRGAESFEDGTGRRTVLIQAEERGGLFLFRGTGE